MRGIRCFPVDLASARTVRTLVAGLSLLLVSPNAFAQSSTTGVPMNAATGRSLADAVTQNEKELIDRAVFGKSSLSSVGVPGVFPTGRLRSSEHDALRPRTDQTFSYETDEASAFANVVFSVPGTVLGGQVKFSGFAGHNWVSLDLKSNDLAVLDVPPQFGHAENESFIIGGSALWAKQATYVLATMVGTWGETKLVDGVDNCQPGPPITCNVGRYRFDTAGFIGSLTAGQVFDLAGASGPKLDLRGSLGYIQTAGDRFTTVDGHQHKYTFSTWTGTGAVTLFNNFTLQNNALLRPYIQAYVRQEWGYENAIEAILNEDPPKFERTEFQQRHTYGGLDAGLTYTLEKMTVGAAVYYEDSGDERTLGGRLGMSWKLN